LDVLSILEPLETDLIRPIALGLIAALTLGAAAQAQTAPAAAETVYSSKTTLIGTLLDNPATKAVLLKDIPEVVNNPQIDQGRDFTLVQIVQYAPELTPEMLAKIDADLATVPHK
jgi:hypothetical protein